MATSKPTPLTAYEAVKEADTLKKRHDRKRCATCQMNERFELPFRTENKLFSRIINASSTWDDYDGDDEPAVRALIKRFMAKELTFWDLANELDKYDKWTQRDMQFLKALFLYYITTGDVLEDGWEPEIIDDSGESDDAEETP